MTLNLDSCIGQVVVVKELSSAGQLNELGRLRGPATTVATLGLLQLVGLGVCICIGFVCLVLKWLMQIVKFVCGKAGTLRESLHKSLSGRCFVGIDRVPMSNLPERGHDEPVGLSVGGSDV